jgi:hypothetical protein
MSAKCRARWKGPGSSISRKTDASPQSLTGTGPARTGQRLDEIAGPGAAWDKPAAPDDYLLLVGNDNDFKAPIVYHNGRPVATNALIVDNILLAYRVTLPGLTTPSPSNRRE